MLRVRHTEHHHNIYSHFTYAFTHNYVNVLEREHLTITSMSICLPVSFQNWI